MLNKNHMAEIRTCQRIKFDQALYILTMYQKKIRNQIACNNDGAIDAEKQYQEKIVRSWNGKWKMDLTKPLLNCVTSVSPRIVLDIPQKSQPSKKQTEIDNYNRVMLQFIRRMRAQHEDQSNFKLTEIDINQKNSKIIKLKSYATCAAEDILSTVTKILQSMRQSIQQSVDNIELQEQDLGNYCMQIGDRIDDMICLCEAVQGRGLSDTFYKFVTYCVFIFDSIKESEFGSTLLALQPLNNQFTYLLHPLFFSIYAYFLREKDQMKAKSDPRENKEQASEQNFPFRTFFSSNNSALSKIVFINLDGYQSEFNLQFARTFRKNLLYISFPKQDIHYENDSNSIYEQRLYKKIMYNWQKNKMNYTNSSSSSNSTFNSNTSSMMQDQIRFADNLYFITHNIENYYENVQKYLYKTQNIYEDVNRNMFVFPLRLNTLNQNFNNLIPQDEDDTIEVYESFAILQIFKYYLINQIKQFGPTFIIVSHSGRLNIEDNHYVQIMQELTKLCHYKLIYFPNLTTRFCPKQKNGVDHEFSLHGIDYLQRNQDQQQMAPTDEETNISYQFFNKIARFLKVSSGTHSLTKNFQEQDILAKHRNLRVLRRVNKLMQILGNENETIQKIRFKNSEIDLIPKLYQKDAQKIVKAFDKLVPLFYSQLYHLLQCILSVCYTPSQQKPYEMLVKYNINPEQIRNNYIIRQLIFFIQSKIVVRGANDEHDKQHQAFNKIKKYLQCQKSKHFLEISQQKYEDSVLLHFKGATNAQLYDNVSQGKVNLSGLIDVSFSNPNKQIKDVMHIYDSTQVLHKVDQHLKTGPIPVLIMNHLPLDKKSVSKFDNYCAFLNRNILQKIHNLKRGDQGIQKIYEEKKIKAYPIKFFDEENREIVESRFQFRTEWNYCQTENYMILFWPQMFNFVEAVAYKLQGRNYQPSILNQFFLGKKQVKNDYVAFYKANVPDDLAPRTGCSTYEFNDFVYIFGGFYDRSNNYLCLQRDITAINLSLYTHDEHRKLQAANIKDDLYEAITAQNSQQVRQKSYIRARREYEFFQAEDLGIEERNVNQGIRSVIMVGGVGQNFIHPFSLLTYYYYNLEFDQNTGKLINIKKCLIYNRSIPVNIRKPTKNMGIIKTPIRNKNQSNGKAIITKPQLTQPYSYARFRIVYKMEGNQLKYKFQYIFSEKDCRMIKQQLRKYDEERYEVSELNNNIRIQKIQGMNHLFMIQKYGSKQIVHMRLDIVDNNEQKQIQYKLTHDSVSFLNVINGNYVCVIVKHPVFTNDRSLLADCMVKNIENQNLSEDQAPYVSLKPFCSDLKGDLTLHIIQASNVNLIYILHGYRLFPSDKIFEYQVTHNKHKKTKVVSQIKPRKQPIFTQKSVPKCCYSTFFYKRADQKNQIICESYLSFEQDKNIVTRVTQYFDPAESNNMSWVLRQPINRYVFCLENSNTPINLQRISFIDFYRQQKMRVFIVQYNRKNYMIKIYEGKEDMGDIQKIELQVTNDALIRSLDEQEFERGTILLKKPEHYSDRGYD